MHSKGNGRVKSILSFSFIAVINKGQQSCSHFNSVTKDCLCLLVTFRLCFIHFLCLFCGDEFNWLCNWFLLGFVGFLRCGVTLLLSSRELRRILQRDQIPLIYRELSMYSPSLSCWVARRKMTKRLQLCKKT